MFPHCIPLTPLTSCGQVCCDIILAMKLQQAVFVESYKWPLWTHITLKQIKLLGRIYSLMYIYLTKQRAIDGHIPYDLFILTKFTVSIWVMDLSIGIASDWEYCKSLILVMIVIIRLNSFVSHTLLIVCFE